MPQAICQDSHERLESNSNINKDVLTREKLECAQDKRMQYRKSVELLELQCTCGSDLNFFAAFVSTNLLHLRCSECDQPIRFVVGSEPDLQALHLQASDLLALDLQALDLQALKDAGMHA